MADKLFGYPAEIEQHPQIEVVFDFDEGRIVTLVPLVRGSWTENGPVWHLDSEKLLRAIELGEERFG